MRVVIVALALLAAGCGPTVDATDAGGVAHWNGVGPGSAVQAAQERCQQTGRTARVTQIDALMGYIAFSCERS